MIVKRKPSLSVLQMIFISVCLFCFIYIFSALHRISVRTFLLYIYLTLIQQSFHFLRSPYKALHGPIQTTSCPCQSLDTDRQDVQQRNPSCIKRHGQFSARPSINGTNSLLGYIYRLKYRTEEIGWSCHASEKRSGHLTGSDEQGFDIRGRR